MTQDRDTTQDSNQVEIQRKQREFQQQQLHKRAAYGAVGYINNIIDNNPQCAYQIAIELEQVIDRYDGNPTPDIHLRTPIPLSTWDAFVLACGKEGYCVEIATKVTLQAIEAYAKSQRNPE